MNRRQFVTATACAAGAPALGVSSPSASNEQRWLAIAESLKPRLHRTPMMPAALVSMTPDNAQFLHWRVESER